MKESETISKYLDIAKYLKKLWNVKVTMKSIVVGTLETIPKSLEKKRLEELEIGRKKELKQIVISSSSRWNSFFF